MRGKSYNIEEVEEGHWVVKYDGSIVLTPLFDLQQISLTMQSLKSNADASKLAADNARLAYMAESRQKWLANQGTVRKGSGDKAAAMMIADSIRGKSIADILKTSYPHSKHRRGRYGKSKVYRELSVKKEGDLERISKLYIKFQHDVFDGISYAEVKEWFNRRCKNEHNTKR